MVIRSAARSFFGEKLCAHGSDAVPTERGWMVDAMPKVGIRQAMIFAFKRTWVWGPSRSADVRNAPGPVRIVASS